MMPRERHHARRLSRRITKPLIYRCGRRWVCHLGFIAGWGDSPVQAYAEYERRL